MNKASYIVSCYKKISPSVITAMTKKFNCSVGEIYEHTYIINADDTLGMCDDLRDEISKLIKDNYLFVAKLTGEASWSGVIDSKWMKKNILFRNKDLNTLMLETNKEECPKETAPKVVAPKVEVKATNLEEMMAGVTDSLNDILKNVGL